MRLKRLATYLFIAVIDVVILLVGTFKETRTEINRATGAMRTHSTRCAIFKKPWTETPTWVSIRAVALGANTDAEWQLLGIRSDGLLPMTRGCNRAPESYQLSYCDESQFTPERRDRFVLAFAKASEPERKEMIRKCVDGDVDF